MKKLFALAALVLGLASCQTEPEGFGVVTGGEVDTVVTVSLPAATRSSEQSGLENVDATQFDLRYILEVYDVNSNNLRVLREVKPYEVTETTVTFPVRLIAGRDYKFVVWADFVANGSKDDNFYNTQEGLYNVTVIDNAWTAMTEARDAYTSFVDVTNYSGTQPINLELTRPFGKLRVVTTDIDALRYIQALPTTVEFQYAAEVYTSFNALYGEAGTMASKSFDSYALINEYGDNVYGEDLENGKQQTLFADYLFVGAEQTLTTKFHMQVSHAYGEKKTEYSFVNDAPIVRNQLTTVIGSILTDANNVKVKIEDEFAAKNTILDVFENGGEYTLTENIELPANNLIVKKDVVLNLGGYTINAGKPDSAEMSGTDIAAITIENGATLTIEGEGTIEGTEYGVYAKNGNVVIKGGNFVAGTSAVQVYNGTATIEDGKFEATKSDVYVVNCIDAAWTNGDAKVAIKGGEFKNFNPANNAAEGVGTCFVADGYISVPAEDNCFEVVEFAGEITLSADITSAKSLVVAEGKSLKLNLGEFDIINAGATEDLGVADAIIVYGELEINGEGTVKGNTRSVWARGNTNAKITINGGHYVGAVVEGGCEVIYASGNGKITINGGTFEAANMDDSSFAAPQYAVLNLHGNGAAGCDIKVYGGSFKNFNPTDNISENPKHNFCAEGYTAVANGEWYDVKDIRVSSDLQSAINNASADSTIYLAGVEFEGTYKVSKDITIKSADINNPATIKGRVNVVSANPTFKNVKFDRNETDSAAAWNTAYGSSNCLQYKAVVMIYGNQANTITFDGCKFFNIDGTHKSAITNVNCELIVNNCYFEGTDSPIYTQANISVTNSEFNFSNGWANICLNGCGNNGGKFIFTNNKISGNQFSCLFSCHTTVGFGNGTYHFNIQDNENATFSIWHPERVTNKTFAEGSWTF